MCRPGENWDPEENCLNSPNFGIFYKAATYWCVFKWLKSMSMGQKYMF
jgi:hypothetical protein